MRLQAKLRANTDEVIARGGFGSPSMFVSAPGAPGFQPVMHWGNDRMEPVDRAQHR